MNELNLNPTKALDLAKDPLPDEAMRVTDSHLYTTRLPVCSQVSSFRYYSI